MGILAYDLDHRPILIQHPFGEASQATGVNVKMLDMPRVIFSGNFIDNFETCPRPDWLTIVTSPGPDGTEFGSVAGRRYTGQ